MQQHNVGFLTGIQQWMTHDIINVIFHTHLIFFLYWVPDRNTCKYAGLEGFMNEYSSIWILTFITYFSKNRKRDKGDRKREIIVLTHCYWSMMNVTCRLVYDVKSLDDKIVIKLKLYDINSCQYLASILGSH